MKTTHQNARYSALVLVLMLAENAYPASMTPRQVADRVADMSPDQVRDYIKGSADMALYRPRWPVASTLALLGAGVIHFA